MQIIAAIWFKDCIFRNSAEWYRFNTSCLVPHIPAAQECDAAMLPRSHKSRYQKINFVFHNKF